MSHQNNGINPIFYFALAYILSACGNGLLFHLTTFLCILSTSGWKMLTSHFTVVEIFNNFPNWALSHGFSCNQATTSRSCHQGLGWLWLPSRQIRKAGRSQLKPRQAKPWQHYPPGVKTGFQASV